MKRLLIVAAMSVALMGCKTVEPVTYNFPTAPKIIMEPCEELNVLARDAQLSDLMITITMNYMKYHECKNKNQGWIDWYNEQRRLYEEATKN
jgi:hypothetical protein